MSVGKASEMGGGVQPSGILVLSGSDTGATSVWIIFMDNVVHDGEGD